MEQTKCKMISFITKYKKYVGELEEKIKKLEAEKKQ